MTKCGSSLLFFTSFFPLWISILFIDIKSCIENSDYLLTEKISIVILSLGILVSSISLGLVLYNNSKEANDKVILKEVYEDKIITTDYLLTYILPLFAFDFTKWDQVTLFLIFYLTLWFLCIKHKYFSVNILLELCNYKIYTCKFENSKKIIFQKKVLSRRELNLYKGDEILLKSFNNEISIEVLKR